eukprot:7117531-Heterocapsa_arctica.AAC.1
MEKDDPHGIASAHRNPRVGQAGRSEVSITVRCGEIVKSRGDRRGTVRQQTGEPLRAHHSLQR